MSKRPLLTLCCAVCLSFATAQHGWQFHPSAFAGFSQGDLGTYGLLKANLAFTHGPWSLGPGAGLDYYRFRTIPLFVSATRDLTSSQRQNAFFVWLDGGLNLPWYKRPLPDYYYYKSSFHSGPWLSIGPGFRWRLSRSHPQALFFTAGYTYKKLKEIQTSGYVCNDPNSCNLFPDRYTYAYLNHILVFCIGLRF